MTEQELIKIEIGTKMYILKIDENYNQFDVDEILKIDYSNIMGEVLTFPVILNKLGILLAEIEDSLRRQNFDYEKTEAELKKERAKAFDRAFQNFKKGGINNPTVSQCEKSAMDDNLVLEKEQESKFVRLKLLDVQRDRDYINSLYWSAKSKDDKLNKLSEKLRPDDFNKEIIEGKLNGISIKSTNKLFS